MALESYLLERREVNFMGCSGFGGINRYLCITWWHALLLIYFFDIFTNRFTFTQWNGYLNYFSISYNFCKRCTSPLEHVCCYLRIVDWHLLLWESDKKNKWSHWKSRQLGTYYWAEKRPSPHQPFLSSCALATSEVCQFRFLITIERHSHSMTH